MNRYHFTLLYDTIKDNIPFVVESLCLLETTRKLRVRQRFPEILGNTSDSQSQLNGLILIVLRISTLVYLGNPELI